MNYRKEKSHNLLILDDDALILEQATLAFQHNLTLNIHTLTCANNLFEYISQHDIDIILLDLQMPFIDGIEVIRLLSIQKFTGLIALYTGADKSIINSALGLGEKYNLNVYGEIKKPISRADANKLILHAYNNAAKKINYTAQNITVEQLQSAINTGKIIPYYQPQIDIKNNCMIGVEILARWIQQDGSLLYPDTFIPVAEQEGLIDQLTITLIEQAFEDYKLWLQLIPTFSISINLSALSLKNLKLPEQLFDLVKKYHLNEELITLEMTESQIILDSQTVLNVLLRLRLKGFKLSIDDFGTGYSSFLQLEQLPFTEIKIDKNFIHGAKTHKSKFIIVDACAKLGHKLNLNIVAEGVEDQSDLDVAIMSCCDLVQGYLFSRPVDKSQIDNLLKKSLPLI